MFPGECLWLYDNNVGSVFDFTQYEDRWRIDYVVYVYGHRKAMQAVHLHRPPCSVKMTSYAGVKQKPVHVCRSSGTHTKMLVESLRSSHFILLFLSWARKYRWLLVLMTLESVVYMYSYVRKTFGKQNHCRSTYMQSPPVLETTTAYPM